MRYLICLIAGLVLGAIVASSVGNAIALRRAWSRGLMQVMQHELGGARAAAHAGQCSGAPARAAAAHLHLLAGDIERAVLAPATRDRVFSQYADELRTTIAQWDADADCAQQSAALTRIANACEACHRDYR